MFAWTAIRRGLMSLPWKAGGSLGLISYFILLCGCRHSHELEAEIGIMNRVHAHPETTDPVIHQPDSLLEDSPQSLEHLKPEPIETTPFEPRGKSDPEQVLSLEEAIHEAFRQQPRLKSQLELIEQSRQGENVAFAPFLPLVSTGYTADPLR